MTDLFLVEREQLQVEMPMKALSIRQPWAWLIVQGHKPVENRSWATHFRGSLLIHASKGMTRAEYEEARELADSLGVQLPEKGELERGGIVGKVTITECVTACESPYFFGKYGFMMIDPTPLPFMPYKGRLGFFTVHNPTQGTAHGN